MRISQPLRFNFDPSLKYPLKAPPGSFRLSHFIFKNGNPFSRYRLGTDKRRRVPSIRTVRYYEMLFNHSETKLENVWDTKKKKIR